MKLAFAVPLGGLEPVATGVGGLEGTILAKDGFLYAADAWGTPYKIDATSGTKGKIVWICDTGITKDPTRDRLANRGIALYGNNVITNLIDGRVVACNNSTGAVDWQKQVTKNPARASPARRWSPATRSWSASPLATGRRAASSPRSMPIPARKLGASTPCPSRASRGPKPGSATRRRTPAAGRPAARRSG